MQNNQYPTIKIPDELANKKQFAFHLLKKPNEPYAAALKVFPDDPGLAVYITQRWVDDEVVAEFKDELLSTFGDKKFIASKNDLSQSLWEMAEKDRDSDTRLKAYKLFAEVNGFISKPDTIINNNMNVDNRTLQVDHYGADERWEETLEEQQRKLIENAASTIN